MPSAPAAASNDTAKHVNVGAIVGPIVAVVAVALIALGLFLWWRRRRQTAPAVQPFAPDVPAPFPRTDRPDIWYKGMVEVPQPTTVIVPVTGKRVQMQERSNGQGSSGSLGHNSDVALLPPQLPPPPPAPASSSARTETSVNESVVPPSTAPPSSTRSRSVDVNQIIELIAQRIDPAVARPTDSDAPPPRYPA